MADSESLDKLRQEIDAVFLRGVLALDQAAAVGGASLPAAAAKKMLVEYRSRYMKGLLKYFKNDPAGAKEMYAAATGIELAQGNASQRSFWRVVLAFFEAMIHDALPADVDARRICNGVEQRLRRVADAGTASGDQLDWEGLMREMVYAIARADTVSERLRSVKEAFRPDAALAVGVDFAFGDADMDGPGEARPALDAGAAKEAEGDFVEIAGLRVSRSLFDLFSEESRAQVATLKSEFEVMQAHGIVPDAMLLAVHGLSGLAGTVHFDNLRDFAAMFARALAPLSLESLSSDEEELIGQAIQTTERMVVEALGLAEPTPDPDLMERLDAIAARTNEESPAPLARETDEVLLPEEEASFGREVDPPKVEMVSARETAPVVLDDQSAGGRQQRRLNDDVDAEMMPAFLQNADRLVTALGAALVAWCEAPAEKVGGQLVAEVLQELKGSARMAGVMSVGELCHHMESRVEAAKPYEIAPPSILAELGTSMNRMGVLFDKFQPTGGVAVEAARAAAARLAPPAGVAGDAGRPKFSVSDAPRMLRVRADLIDGLIDSVDAAGRARQRAEEQLRALRDVSGNLKGIHARLRERATALEAVAGAEGKRVGLAADDVAAFEAELHSIAGALHAAIGENREREVELRNGVARLRMLPVGSLAERMHRVVRLCAKDLGKRASLDIEGAHMELDRAQLEHLAAPLEVLLRNAVIHGIEGSDDRLAKGKQEIGAIRIDIKPRGEVADFSVSDDGAGLNLDRVRERGEALGWIAGQSTLSNAEITEFIFRGGFSKGSAGEAIEGATAESLAAARRALESLGGGIELASSTEGPLSFHMWMPIHASRADAPNPMLDEQPGQADARPGAGPVPWILVVDESLSARNEAKAVFEREGYRVSLARDADAAFAALVAGAPDALVISADLPRLDGIELTRKLREDNRFADVPIVVTGVVEDPARGKLAEQAGADHFLAKPYQEEELLRHVAGFIAAVRAANNYRE